MTDQEEQLECSNPGVLEDIQLKLEDFEDYISSLKEFTLEKLHFFQERLQDMENKQGEGISLLRDELSNLSDSFQSQECSFTAVPVVIKAASTHEPTPSNVCKFMSLQSSSKDIVRNGASFQRPVNIDDVSDPALREELKPFTHSSLDAREKLTKVQTAFVHLRLHKNPNAKGRKDDGRKLFEACIRRRMWSHSIVGEGISEPCTYITEKIRTVIRRQRLVAKKKSLNKEFDLVDSMMYDN